MSNPLELEKIESYKLSLEKHIPIFLLPLKDFAKQNDVPIISDEVKDFLDIILELTRPQILLEIGTAIGYSALCMAQHDFVKKVITIENYHERVLQARFNLMQYDKYNKIDIIEEDADVALDELYKNECYFDFIFLDSAKSQYINWLPKIKKILKKDGILITDNVFNNMETLKSRSELKKRSRSMHDSLKEYLSAIKKDKEFYSKILNIGDGICYVKKTDYTLFNKEKKDVRR